MTRQKRLDREFLRYEAFFKELDIQPHIHDYKTLCLPEETKKLLELASLTVQGLKCSLTRNEKFYQDLAFVRGCMRYANMIGLDDIFKMAGARLRRGKIKTLLSKLHCKDNSAPHRQVYDATKWYYSLQTKPEIDAIRSSQRLTAADYAVTINCRG